MTTPEPKTPRPAGMYPQAHFTAPGGMSEKALVAELVRDAGYTRKAANALTWAEKIDHAIQSRLAVEANADALEVGCTCTIVGWMRTPGEPHIPARPEWALAEDCAVHAPDPVQEVMAANEGKPVGEVEEALADADLWADDEDEEDDDEFLLVKPEPVQSAEHGPESGRPQDFNDITAALAAVEQTADRAPLTLVPEPADEVTMFMTETSTAQAEQKASQPESLFIGMPGTLDYVFDGHAGASPSGAERWAHCTASLGASRKFLETLTPNQQVQFARGGDAARQGTTAHAAGEAELLLMLGLTTQEEYENTLLDLTLTPADGEEYDAEMAEHLSEYVDYVKQLHDAGRPLLIEQRVFALIPLTDMHEGETHTIPGSGDCVALPSPEERVLTVGDLKYGNGIDVSVEANPQVRIYALGALDLLVDDEGYLPDLDRVEYVIVQPRLGGIKVWSESLDDLLAWRDEVLAPALTKALYGIKEGATYNPSESACQWCPARGGCAALAETRVEQAAGLFDTIIENGDEFPETETLTDTRLGELLAQVSALVQIKDDLKAEAERRLYRGGSIPGWQLVNYTPPRTWKSDAAQQIETAIQDGEIPPLYKPKALLTPKQALTLLGEKASLIENLIDTPDKRPVVAPEGDRRKTWQGRAPEDMFGLVTDDEAEEGVA